MPLDLGSAIAAALRSREVTDAIVEVVRPVLADEIAQALARQVGDKMQPLAEIMGVTNAAARMREQRDPGLTSLAVRVGRRRLYSRREVVDYLRAKSRPARLRVHAGGRP